MSLLDVTFDIPSHIAEGLHCGALERFGGVIRDVGTKQVVMWLRENGLPPISPSELIPPLDPFNPFIGTLDFVATVAKATVEVKGFTVINERIDEAGRQLDRFGNNIQQMQGVLQIASAASILNFGVSVVGFGIVINRLGKIEERLKQLPEAMNQIERKVDNVQEGVDRVERNQGLAFCANFHTALELANNAFIMFNPENRRASALQGINRFLEAQYIYAAYTEAALEISSQAVEECLLLLSLAYMTEVRCHLELGETSTALSRLQQGSLKLRPLYERYLKSLLTSNPAAYLHPNLKNEIDLERLVKVYQWLDPIHTESSVFQELREGYFKIAQSPDKWISSLHPAVLEYIKHKGVPKIYTYLPQVMEKIESMIETHRRFEAYQTEVKAIAQLGISFHDWLQLTPKEAQPEGSNLMYIIPAEPLSL